MGNSFWKFLEEDMDFKLVLFIAMAALVGVKAKPQDRQLEGKECLVDDDCGDLEKYWCDINIFVCKDMNDQRDRQLEGKECLVDDDCGDLERYFCDINIFVCKDVNDQ